MKNQQRRTWLLAAAATGLSGIAVTRHGHAQTSTSDGTAIRQPAALLCAGLDVPEENRADMEEWHSKEHLLERLSLPGFLRGRRYINVEGDPRYFIMYEMQRLADLASPEYVERLNKPTAWTQKITPLFRGNFRVACELRASAGASVGGFLMVARLAPANGVKLMDSLDRPLMEGLCKFPGVYKARFATPDRALSTLDTTEARKSGHKFESNWLLLVEGNSPESLKALLKGPLSTTALADKGADGEPIIGIYRTQALLTKMDI